MNASPLVLSCLLMAALIQVSCSSSPKQPPRAINPASPVLSGNDYKYDPEQAAVANARLGVEYMKQGRYKVALAKLKKALEQDDNNHEAHVTAALLYEQLGQLDVTNEHFAKALKLRPKDASTHNNYASYLCRQQQFALAQEHFKQAMKDPLYDTLELVHTNIGLCALRFNQTVQARESFETALKDNPDFSTALYQLAELHEQKGEINQALQYFERYEKVAPHTAQTLWLGVRIARALGQRDREANYAFLLKSNYPNTEFARLLGLSEQNRY